jgi:hypothetical protein
MIDLAAAFLADILLVDVVWLSLYSDVIFSKFIFIERLISI